MKFRKREDARIGISRGRGEFFTGTFTVLLVLFLSYAVSITMVKLPGYVSITMVKLPGYVSITMVKLPG